MGLFAMTSILKHPVIIVIITVIALFYYLSLDKSAQKAETSSQTVKVLEDEISQMNSEVSVLEKQLEAVNHPVAQEKVIRNELLLQKPGEYILQLPNIEVEEAKPVTNKEKSPWEEWKKVLF